LEAERYSREWDGETEAGILVQPCVHGMLAGAGGERGGWRNLGSPVKGCPHSVGGRLTFGGEKDDRGRESRPDIGVRLIG